MPFTPMHLGPGLLFKPVLGKHLSLTMFAFTQIAMDVEVLVRIAAGSRELHGFTNTVLGATAVLVIALPVGKPICEWCLRQWNAGLDSRQPGWRIQPESISWRAASLGAVAGVYSHLILDAIMHADASPWAPFTHDNNLLALLTHSQLHLFCVATGGIGVALLATTFFTARR